MRYVIEKAELLRDKVKIFPFGRFFRGGRWRTFTRADGEEMVRNFRAGRPNRHLPVNVEHNIALGRVGTIVDLWVEEDGVYARFEWNEVGRRLLRQERFLFFSPEIAWTWPDKKTGKIYRNVLVGGALTNYPFHGDDTMLFSAHAQEAWSVLEKLGVLEINPLSLRNVSDQELLSLHRRMHMLAVSLRKSAPTVRDVHVPRPLGEEEDLRGIYLVAPHARWIAEGRKKGIVKGKRYHIEGEPLYLIEDGRAYGIVVFGPPREIDRAEFRSLEKEHRISEEMRARWWPDHAVLWYYPVKEFRAFDAPRRVHVPRGVQTFLRRVEFLDSAEEEGFVSIEDVVNAHLTIVAEMQRRGMQHAPQGPQNWLDRQTQRMLKSTASAPVRRLAKLREQDLVLIPGFVSIVGSAVKGQRPNDLDVLIRAEGEGRHLRLSKHALYLPLRKLLDPYKEGLPVRYIQGAQGPHDDALILGDLVLRIRPRFFDVQKDAQPVEKRVRTFIYFVGTGALHSRRRPASLMVSSERSAVLFDAGEGIEPRHLPRVPDIILVTDPTENMKEARRLAEQLGVEAAHGDWSGPDLEVTAFPVKHTNHDVFGYRIQVSDLVIVYAPEFWEFPTEAARNADIGIFDGSAFDRPIRFAGGVGGHAALTDTLVAADEANVKRVIFTHIGEPVERNLGLLQAAGVEIAMDGQAVVVKAGLEPGRQNFRPLKTGRGYGQNEFADPDTAWEVWGRDNAPFAVEEKYDGWRLIVHKQGDRVMAFSEDARTDIASRLGPLAEDVRKVPGNFILDGELEIYAAEAVRTRNFNYEKGEKIERMDMPSFLRREPPLGAFTPRYYAFDLLYRDGDIHRLPWTERRKALVSLLRGRETDRLRVAPTRVVDNKAEFKRALKWAFDQPNSEGAMLKRIAAPYPLNGETLEWAKVKAFKEVRVRVVDKRRSGRGAWIYTGALSDGTIIGNTYATGIDADIGDVLELRVAEIKARREGDKLRFTWDNPIVVSKKPRGTAVTTPQQALALSRLRRSARLPRVPRTVQARKDVLAALVREEEAQDREAYRDQIHAWVLATLEDPALAEGVTELLMEEWDA